MYPWERFPEVAHRTLVYLPFCHCGSLTPRSCARSEVVHVPPITHFDMFFSVPEESCLMDVLKLCGAKSLSRFGTKSCGRQGLVGPKDSHD